jgi:hypothetical protein
MRTSPVTATVLAVAVLLIAACPADGQERNKDSSADAARPALSLDFPGGSVGEFLEVVRKADPEFNYVLFDNGLLNETAVPRISLRNVTSSQIVELLEGAEIGTPIQVEQLEDEDDGGKLLYRVTLMPKRHRDNQRMLRVFPLGAVAEMLVGPPGTAARTTPGERQKQIDEQVAQMMELIQAAHNINAEGGEGAPTPPNLHFHPATRMLIMKGTGEQLETAEEVVQAFQEAAHAQRELMGRGAGFGRGGEEHDGANGNMSGGGFSAGSGAGSTGGGAGAMGSGGGAGDRRPAPPTTRP